MAECRYIAHLVVKRRPRGGQAIPASEAGPAETLVWCDATLAGENGEAVLAENEERFCRVNAEGCYRHQMRSRVDAAETDLSKAHQLAELAIAQPAGMKRDAALACLAGFLRAALESGGRTT